MFASSPARPCCGCKLCMQLGAAGGITTALCSDHCTALGPHVVTFISARWHLMPTQCQAESANRCQLLLSLVPGIQAGCACLFYQALVKWKSVAHPKVFSKTNLHVQSLWPHAHRPPLAMSIVIRCPWLLALVTAVRSLLREAVFLEGCFCLVATDGRHSRSSFAAPVLRYDLPHFHNWDCVQETLPWDWDELHEKVLEGFQGE